ncbi:MFS general substrate transporter [Guyanagaster necrorhizus]|uniref:MFS general substrate transporter n=1 Tax=Guyanagaster necrorhizus TaxID=856835 RepID=A0A9P7W628_9AGAR|nr:MFS general substrate transporter [Guyanagaster necrorhizus MCA 3950]KAG7453145.1 MFS general substrate transporter [Guyanagaster necrorhizus MCA 3950]
MANIKEQEARGGVNDTVTLTNAKDFGIIPVPRSLRYDPGKPFNFSLAMNIAFGAISTFTVANLYYCQPLLIELSKDFDVTYEEVSRIPTLLQAGYATGLILITPLGDLVRRRQLVLILITVSASLTIGLSVTSSLAVFEALSFLVGAVTVVPQVLMPLAVDLAPPQRRASALSIVLAGLLLGILLARVLSGVIGEFTSWRVVYYLAIGLQYFLVLGSYFVVPDFPAKNAHLTYWHILQTMAKFAVTEPLLIQACLISIGSSASFTNFWVTLTFLLGGDPYNYSTLVIGLFGLIGMFAVAMGPILGRAIDHLVPWYASLIGIFMMLCSQAVQTGAGGISIGAVIITTIGIDTFRQMLEVSLATRIYSINPEARARLNAVYILSLFIGQVMGSSVGTKVFVQYGWRAGGALSMAFCGWMLFILMLRGPHCGNKTWFGYQGGWEARKNVVEPAKEIREEDKQDIEMGTDSRSREMGEKESEIGN